MVGRGSSQWWVVDRVNGGSMAPRMKLSITASGGQTTTLATKSLTSDDDVWVGAYSIIP